MKMVSRREWGARPPKARAKMTPANVTHLFLHHAAGAYPSGRDGMRRIQTFHMDGRGWNDFAYSVGVSPDGQVFEGRGWDAAGGHTRGWNSKSVAVCYLGWGTEEPSDAAKRAILWAADDADRHYGRKLVRQAHRDVGATACPGDGLYAWWTSGARLEPSEGSSGGSVAANGQNAADATTERPDPYLLKPSWVSVAAWDRLRKWAGQR